VRPKRKQFFSVGRAYANVGTASILWNWKSVHSHVWPIWQLYVGQL